MRYLRDAAFWEGYTDFAPVGARVEILLSGDPSGPTDAQRAFLRSLEARYHQLWPELKQHLAEAAVAHLEERAQPTEFILAAIDLPAQVHDSMAWELVYETRPPSWCFAIQMRGWTVTNISVEC